MLGLVGCVYNVGAERFQTVSAFVSRVEKLSWCRYSTIDAAVVCRRHHCCTDHRRRAGVVEKGSTYGVRKVATSPHICREIDSRALVAPSWGRAWQQ